MQVDQSCGTFDRRWWLIEPNVASPPNTQHLQIYSPVAFYLLLVSLTELPNFFFGKLTIGDVYVFFGDVDVVEQVIPHKVIVTLDVVLGDRVVLVQVKGHHILEGYLSLLTHLYQLLIHLHWRAPCS